MSKNIESNEEFKESLSAAELKTLLLSRLEKLGSDCSSEAEDKLSIKQNYLAASYLENEKSVPEVLIHVVSRYYDAERAFEKKKRSSEQAKTASVPVLMLSLGKNTLRVIKSSLQGIELVTSPVVATRSAVAEKQPAGLELTQPFPGGNGKIEYWIVRESEKEVFLSLRLTDIYGNFQLTLKRDGRIVGSSRLNRNDNTANFDRLTAGKYDVLIQGSDSASFSILIENENENRNESDQG